MTDDEIRELIEDLELVLGSVESMDSYQLTRWTTEEFILYKWINQLRKQIGMPLTEPRYELAHPLPMPPPDSLAYKMITMMDRHTQAAFLRSDFNGLPLSNPTAPVGDSQRSAVSGNDPPAARSRRKQSGDLP